MTKAASTGCNPDIVVFSDGPQQYATQEEADTYARHASGVTFNGRTLTS